MPPPMARSTTRGIRRLSMVSGRALACRVERPQTLDVGFGQAGGALNVGPGAESDAIAAEEGRDVAAEPEEVHDVAKIVGVGQSQRVPDLVDAGQIDDGVAQQR